MENFKKFLLEHNPTEEDVFNYFEAKRLQNIREYQELLCKQRENHNRQVKEVKLKFIEAINALKMEIK